ncbi:hypothetical protein F4779DRAFT_585540 [Xylariaceae sp. FL0662B]|nr:hypothetical protein F4779DRAFT_585540 [Xylariaceae sp. FL0662B]
MRVFEILFVSWVFVAGVIAEPVDGVGSCLAESLVVSGTILCSPACLTKQRVVESAHLLTSTRRRTVEPCFFGGG